MEDRKLYALYCVTATGFFTVVQGARPTDDAGALYTLEELVERLRPGRGRSYELFIARVNESMQPDAEDVEEIRRIQGSL